MSARTAVTQAYGLQPARMRHAPAQSGGPIDFDAVPVEVLNAAVRAHIVAAATNPQARGAPEAANAPAAESAVSGMTTAEAEKLAILATGCTGGIALDTLAPHGARSLAVIGTGRQARAQLAAAVLTRKFDDIRLYSRQPVAATELAKAYTKKLGFSPTVSALPEEAVHKADVVILATNSPEPVIDADWVAPYAHVTTVGPGLRARHELPLGLIQRARTIVSDDPVAIRDNPEHMLADNPALKRLNRLGQMIGRFNPDRNRGMTLFFSEGLPGMDAALAAAARQWLARD